jgi:flap endonuclease-1
MYKKAFILGSFSRIMGVNLSDIVSRKEIKFDQLRDRIVAVDAFNMLYQFLASIRGADGTPLKDSKGNVTSHLQGLFSRSLNLMGKGLKLVYVFDGESPQMKAAEKERRRGLKKEAAEKFEKASDEDDIALMDKYSARMSRLDSGMVLEAKELVKALGLPYVEAPTEADAQISYMCKKEEVYCAASMDYDCLLFGSPLLVRNLTLSQKRKVHGGKFVYTFLELMELDKVLKELEIDHNQLIALGILVGTDFNVGGVSGIGPKKALKLVKEKSIEEIFADVDFDWRWIFDFFKECPHTDDYELEWGKVDVGKVKEILVDRHEFNLERVDSMLEKFEKELEKNNQEGLFNYF